MHDKTEQSEALTSALAEGIAAIMAAGAELDEDDADSGDMADLFLEELNRLWSEPAPDLPFDEAAWVA